jgi:hypothetical protein
VGGVAALLLLAVGCFFLDPMSDPEKSKIDPELLGVWKKTGGAEVAVFYPFDARCYLVAFYPPEGGPQFFKGFLTQTEGGVYINLQMLSPRALWRYAAGDQDHWRDRPARAKTLAKEKGLSPTFFIARLARSGKLLTVQFVTPKDVKEGTTLAGHAEVAAFVTGQPERLQEPATYALVDNPKAELPEAMHKRIGWE